MGSEPSAVIAIWLQVKNMYQKLNPGKWKHGPKPAVPWRLNFDPCPFGDRGPWFFDVGDLQQRGERHGEEPALGMRAGPAPAVQLTSCGTVSFLSLRFLNW